MRSRNVTWVFKAAALALAAATILAACGGGSSSNGTMASPAAMAAPSSASGAITGFGSVYVNGVEYATNASTRVLDGDNDDAASATSALQVGMTVDVDSAAASGAAMATLLRFTSAVRGEVDAVDNVGNTLTVMGQTVQITSGTSFAGSRTANGTTTQITQLSGINVNDYVIVYGYVECNAACGSGATTLVATLVDEPASAGMYRVEGYVTNFATGSFMINGLTVDIAASGSTPTVCNPVTCAFNNGDFVAVRSGTAPSGSPLTLAAASVKLRPQIPTFTVGATVQIEGPVSQLNGTGFIVRGVPVDGSGLASTVAGLVDNQIVEVTGTVSSSGGIVATAIFVERYATMAIMGALDSVSSSGLSVLGQSFSVGTTTRFMDWAQGVRPFNASNFATVLHAGDQVVVGGYPSSGGGNIATRVERIPTPATPTAGVQGVVSADSASSDTLTIAGVPVAVSSTTQLFYQPNTGTGLAGFFAAITPNTSVAIAVGSPISGTITANEAAVLRPHARWSY